MGAGTAARHLPIPQFLNKLSKLKKGNILGINTKNKKYFTINVILLT
jgi:hypothetical protein